MNSICLDAKIGDSAMPKLNIGFIVNEQEKDALSDEHLDHVNDYFLEMMIVECENSLLHLLKTRAEVFKLPKDDETRLEFYNMICKRRSGK
jgi:hypothetical protein